MGVHLLVEGIHHCRCALIVSIHPCRENLGHALHQGVDANLCGIVAPTVVTTAAPNLHGFAVHCGLKQIKNVGIVVFELLAKLRRLQESTIGSYFSRCVHNRHARPCYAQSLQEPLENLLGHPHAANVGKNALLGQWCWQCSFQRADVRRQSCRAGEVELVTHVAGKILVRVNVSVCVRVEENKRVLPGLQFGNNALLRRAQELGHVPNVNTSLFCQRYVQGVRR